MSSRPPLLGREPDPELAERVFARSEGNPLFMEALLRSDTLADPGLPGSLRDLVLADVRRLPARTQQVLEALSVARQHSGQALLAALQPAGAVSRRISCGAGEAGHGGLGPAWP